jgi:hypothetical protein
MSRTKPTLVEGLDYYLEGGKFVFTAAYHVKRGYCCNSKCRHCPYRADAVQTSTIRVVGVPLIKLPGGRGG